MYKKAILLDAGGIILDETQMENEYAHFSVSILSEINPEYSIKQFWDDTEESVIRFTPRTRPYIFWKYCNGDVNLYKNILAKFDTLRNKWLQSLKLMNGIIPELKELATRFDLVLAGQYGNNIYDLLQENGISNLFKNRLSQDDFEITKPDPRYIENIAKASNFHTKECIMVGDRIDNDVIPAKQNKMGTVFIKTGIYKTQEPRDPEEIPDLILENISGMANLIINKWSK